MTESWWLKYERAQQHRREAEAMIANVFSDPAPTITVSKAFSNGRWEFSMHHDAEIPEMLPVVIGDYLFGLRSALDHIVSKNMTRRTNKTPFPIYHQDFLTRVPAEPPQFASYRQNWKALKAHLPPGVFAVVELAQPFIICKATGTDPLDAGLTILNDVQNSDKHNELLGIFGGIAVDVGTVVYPNGDRVTIQDAPKGGAFVNGSRFVDSEVDAEVELLGEVRLMLKSSSSTRLRPLPESLDDLSVEVEAVLQTIERNMP
jgi:hypothetical protein